MSETNGRSRTQMAMPADWLPLLQDLAGLDQAGALDGIRAIAAARRVRVRAGADNGHTADFLLRAAQEALSTSARLMDRDGFATAAALLAAVIDRMDACR